jgi:hypothetical protein
MAHVDPKQEVIAKLSRFLTPSKKVRVDTTTYKPVGINTTAIHDTIEGFRFLRERAIPGIPGRMMLVASNDVRAPEQLLICYLEQDAEGQWRYSGGASTGLGGKSEQPRVNLGGGGWPDHFHAGGYVVPAGQDIARVRLLSVNGVEMIDEVIGEIVLFFTNQAVELPLLAELYNRDGKLVSDHNVFGANPHSIKA